MRGLGTTKVIALPDNTLKIGADRYVEVDENLFRKVEGSDRIAFQENKEGEIDSFVIDGLGVMQFYRASGFFNVLLKPRCQRGGRTGKGKPNNFKI